VSRENVEIGRLLVDASNRREKAAFVALCDPDLEWVPPAEWPETATIRGVEAVWDFIVELDEPWEEGAYELVEVVDGGGDKVAWHFRREVRGRTSGVDTAFDYWTVTTFREAKVLRFEWFADRHQALAAAAG
jgi:ketosteroid isomerase-like protein